MDKELIEFLNEIMDNVEVPRRLRLWALQIKTTETKPMNKKEAIQAMREEKKVTKMREIWIKLEK